ncbi:MAG TPA: hypothetical protein VN224_04485 [Xanthomonadales bacterium]|nr:hypothetical protein [Xanthomonadales bacterium]
MRATFVDRIEHLRSEVRGWLARDPKLALNDRPFVVEDVLGRYEAPGLEIVHDGSPVATVQPLSAAVIGAQGRLDVKGPLDEVPVVYLESAGRMETRRARGGDVVHLRPLFRGVEGPGWYWITGSTTREVRRIDESSFRAILIAVSDYEISEDSA